SAPISTALATRSSGSSTGSNSVVGWRRATTGLPPTTLPSFSSRQSGYGCALISPRPNTAYRSSPLIPHHALAGVACGDVRELALEGGGGRPAAQPFHLDGGGGERGVGRARRAVDDEARAGQ